MPQRLDVPDHANDERQTMYLARLWYAPADPAMAWAVDDWVFDSDPPTLSVTEVLSWAETQGASAFELFCRTSDQQDWIRLHGSAADGRETLIQVLLTIGD